MKRLLSLFLLGTILLFLSCSEDDNSGDAVINDKNYFPLVVDNSWDFKNTYTALGANDTNDTETINVSGTSQVSGNQAYSFSSNNPESPALTTLILTQGVMAKNTSSLLYTGEFGFGIPGFENIVFDLENVPVYNKQLDPDTEMYFEEITFTEQFQGLPIILNFEITTKMGDSFDNMEVNDVSYTDVISSEWIINLEVLLGLESLSTPIVQNQNISNLSIYFAKDIGMIKSESNLTINFEDVEMFPLEDIDTSTLQELIDYDVVLE